jgi:hypothetical protein
VVHRAVLLDLDAVVARAAAQVTENASMEHAVLISIVCFAEFPFKSANALPIKHDAA